MSNIVLHVGAGNNESWEHEPWYVIADEHGGFVTSWFIPFDQDELGATLELTATGLISGLRATTIFTDNVRRIVHSAANHFERH